MRLVYIGGVFAPMLYCDICSQRIHGARSGATVGPAANVRNGDSLDLTYVPQGTCM